jgi:hypothetical protein
MVVNLNSMVIYRGALVTYHGILTLENVDTGVNYCVHIFLIGTAYLAQI